MKPIAFAQNNSHILNTEMAVILFVIILGLVIGTVYNVKTYNPEKDFLKKAVLHQAFLALIAGVSGTLFISHAQQEIDTVENLMIVQIQEKYKIEDLTAVENLDIYCDSDYKSSVNAMVWTEKDVKATGILIGEKRDGECRFVLEETVEKDPFKKRSS